MWKIFCRVLTNKLSIIVPRPCELSFETTILQSNSHSVKRKHKSLSMIPIQKNSNTRTCWCLHFKSWKHENPFMISLQKIENTRTRRWSPFIKWKHENSSMIALQELRTQKLINDCVPMIALQQLKIAHPWHVTFRNKLRIIIKIT